MLAIPPSAPGLRKKDLSARRVRTVQVIGDSFTTAQRQCGLYFAATVNVTGIEIRGAGITCPSGTGTLSWDADARTLTWAAPGDTAGTPVVVSDGLFTLPSSNPAYALRVGVTARSLPVANQTDSLASTTRYWRRSIGDAAHIVEALSERSIAFLPDLGIGGNRSIDLLGRIGQALAAAPDAFLINVGTNDVRSGVAPDVLGANLASILDALLNSGALVGVNLIAPRFGAFAANGVAASDAGFTAALQWAIVNSNRIMDSVVRSRNGATVFNNWTKLVDIATGKAANWFTLEGLHPSGSMALVIALAWWEWLKTLSPRCAPFSAVASGSGYDAANNPGGNLLTGDQGSFVGTGGTTGTGASLTPNWATGTAYTKDAFVISGGNLWRSMNAGTSGAAAPTGQHTVSDGAITWAFQCSGVLAGWSASSVKAAGDTVVTSAGRMYLCTVAGTTGATAPSHMTGTATDGTATWLFQAHGLSSGLAAGWTVQRSTGAAVTVQCHKVLDPAGGPFWQEFIISGATGDERTGGAEEITFYSGYPSVANMSVGDVIDTSLRVQVVDGAGCYGFYGDAVYTGGLSITHDALHLKNCYAGLGAIKDPFVFALEPIPWFSGITAALPRFKIQFKTKRHLSGARSKLRNGKSTVMKEHGATLEAYRCSVAAGYRNDDQGRHGGIRGRTRNQETVESRCYRISNPAEGFCERK